MPTIKLKTYDPEIWDDPELCGDGKEKCDFSHLLIETCPLFKAKLHFNGRVYEKCDECKKHWQLNQPQPLKEGERLG